MKVFLSESKNSYDPAFLAILVAYQHMFLGRPNAESEYRSAVSKFVQDVAETRPVTSAHALFIKHYKRFEQITEADDPVDLDFVDSCYDEGPGKSKLSVRVLIDQAVARISKQNLLDEAGTAVLNVIQNSDYIKSLPRSKRVKAFNELVREVGVSLTDR
jgi:hypothetical protein